MAIVPRVVIIVVDKEIMASLAKRVREGIDVHLPSIIAFQSEWLVRYYRAIVERKFRETNKERKWNGSSIVFPQHHGRNRAEGASIFIDVSKSERHVRHQLGAWWMSKSGSARDVINESPDRGRDEEKSSHLDNSSVAHNITDRKGKEKMLMANGAKKNKWGKEGLDYYYYDDDVAFPFCQQSKR